MKPISLLAFAALLLTRTFTAHAAQVLDIDFTYDEGFRDGQDLDGIQDMNAQGTWDAQDTGGTGYAASSAQWQRARNYTSFTLEVDHSVIIETTLRLTDADGTWDDADTFKIGFAEFAQHAGTNTPSIGSTIHTSTDGGYWLGGDASDNRIYVDAEDAGDWVRFTQTIFRSAAGDEFKGYVSATNLTDGVDLGTAPVSWTESTDDGSWGGSMRPSFRTWGNFEATALEIDRWVVSTSTEPPPVSGTNTVGVTVDLTRQLYIGGVTRFDREQFTNLHGTGSKGGTGGFSADEAAYLIDTNKVRFGRSVGGFQWVRSEVTDEDPNRAGYINTNALATWCRGGQDGNVNNWPWIKLGYQPLVYTDHTSIFPGQSHANLFDPTNNEAAAEWASVVWQNWWTAPKRPRYYEPINEPYVHATEMGTTPAGINDFHAAIIDRIHQDVPGLQVGGPCSAWPVFSLNGYAHFRERVGAFIDRVGDRTDFVSWHIYSTFTETGDLEPDSVGANADWQLDLVENYGVNRTGRQIPILITEYGGGYKNHASNPQWDHYSDERDWHILKSVMGKCMTFQERPDTVAKTIPFISEKATWYAGYETNPYPYVTYRKVGGVWVETHLPKFFAFWKNVEGDRFPVATDDPDLQAHVYVTNSTAHVCMNNIDHTEPAIVNVAALLEPGVSVQSASLTRLYFDGATPVLEEQMPLASLSNIVLRSEEAAAVHLVLNQAPSRNEQLYRKSHYGDRTMVAYSGSPERFMVHADMNRGAVQGAMLKVGVTRGDGAPIPPLVTFNDVALDQATDWPGGMQADRDDFDGTIRMEVPAHLVLAVNTVDVSFATSGGYISTVILNVDSELPFDFSIVAEAGPTDLVMSWDSSPAFDYAVRTSGDLASGDWSTVDTLAGTGATMYYTNSLVDPQAFFRVEAALP